jgi:hypothetical protein
MNKTFALMLTIANLTLSSQIYAASNLTSTITIADTKNDGAPYFCAPGGDNDACLTDQVTAKRYCFDHGTRLPSIFELASEVTPERISISPQQGFKEITCINNDAWGDAEVFNPPLKYIEPFYYKDFLSSGFKSHIRYWSISSLSNSRGRQSCYLTIGETDSGDAGYFIGGLHDDQGIYAAFRCIKQ